MDIQLPVMDGYEATRRIKADPDLQAIPIIVVTSYALSGDEDKARAAGCDAYVTKPYSPRQLLAKIREFLAMKSSHASDAQAAAHSDRRRQRDQPRHSRDAARRRMATRSRRRPTARRRWLPPREQLPDLILLDVMMPKIDGIEVCRRLKADASMPFMPIILVTAKADSKDVVAGLEAGRRRISDQAGRPDRRWSRASNRCCASRSLHDHGQAQAARARRTGTRRSSSGSPSSSARSSASAG